MRKLIWFLFLVAGLLSNALDSAKSLAQNGIIPRSDRANDDNRGDLLFFGEGSDQVDEFNDLLAAHRSHRSHSSHRSHYSSTYSRGHTSHTSHYSSRYSSPAPSTIMPAISAPAAPKTYTPKTFKNWSTTNFNPATSQDACANSGSFAWCVSKNKDQVEHKAVGVKQVGAASLYALLKVTFPKGPVKISRQTPMWYSIDDKKPVSCTITDATETGTGTLVNFAPENITAFDTGCKKGNKVAFTVRDGGKEQTESFSLSGFTQAYAQIFKEMEESLKSLRQ